MLVFVGLSVLVCGRGGAFHLAVPPLPDLAVVSLTLAPLFLLVVLGALLGTLAFIPVSLPLVDVTEAFMMGMVGMDALMSTN